MQSDRCVGCARYEGELECEAYPNGIPEEIITGLHDHTEPFEGDGGLRFVPLELAAEPHERRKEGRTSA